MKAKIYRDKVRMTIGGFSKKLPKEFTVIDRVELSFAERDHLKKYGYVPYYYKGTTINIIDGLVIFEDVVKFGKDC